MWHRAGLNRHCQLGGLQKTKSKENINSSKQFLKLLFLYFTIATWKYFTRFFLPFKPTSLPECREHALLSTQTRLCLPSVVWSLSAGGHEEITPQQSVMKLKLITIWKAKVASLHAIFIKMEVFLDLRERMLDKGQEACGVRWPLGVACLG